MAKKSKKKEQAGRLAVVEPATHSLGPLVGLGPTEVDPSPNGRQAAERDEVSVNASAVLLESFRLVTRDLVATRNFAQSSVTRAERLALDATRLRNELVAAEDHGKSLEERLDLVVSERDDLAGRLIATQMALEECQTFVDSVSASRSWRLLSAWRRFKQRVLTRR